MIPSRALTAVATGFAGRARLAVSLLLALAALSWGACAFAHAALISTAPAAGTLLSNPPTVIQLDFDEPVTPLVLKLIRPDGVPQALPAAQAIGHGVRIPMPDMPQQGTYALSWRVVSPDGHPIGGALLFSVGTAGAGPMAAAQAPPARTFLIWLGTSVWYAALIAGVGLAGCAALASALRARRTLGLWLLAIAGVSTLLNVGLLGIDALDLPVAGLLQAQAWRLAAATSFGLSALLAVLAILCAAMLWFVRPPAVRKTLALLSFALLGASLAASGHASTAPPAWLARPAVWLHGVALTLWVGSLLPLYCVLDTPPGGPSLLGRFSRLIPAALFALLGSGAVLIYLQFDTPASLWQTAYGLVLIAKLALVAILLGLGAYNRYRLTGAVLSARAGATRMLRRVIATEGVVAIAILATVALWRFTPPPRALDAAAAAAVHVVSAHIHSSHAMVDLNYQQPLRGGPSALSLYLSTPDFENLSAKEVHVAFFNTAAGIEPIVFQAHQADDGSWNIQNIALPRQDHWDVRIDILVSDFKRISLETVLSQTQAPGRQD